MRISPPGLPVGRGRPLAVPLHIFTKALDKGTFIKFRNMMMNIHAPLREALTVALDGLHGEASRLAHRLTRQL